MTERVACLLVPDLPLAALFRAEPALEEQAVGITVGQSPSQTVLTCNALAQDAGVVVGMSVPQALSLLPNLLLRASSADQLRCAQAALRDVADAFSPRVSVDELPTKGRAGFLSGQVYLDVTGLQHHYPNEQTLGAALIERARQVGLECRVGISNGPLMSWLAALVGNPQQHLAPTPSDNGFGFVETSGLVHIVQPGAEGPFLAPLPIALLNSSQRVQTALERFGIQRLGQLSELPSAELGRRLGPEGIALWHMARGEKHPPLVATPSQERLLEQCSPEWSIRQLMPLVAELSQLLRRLSERLACRGMSTDKLHLGFELEQGRDQRTLALAAPTRDVDTWLRIVHLELEQNPPQAAVVGICVEATPMPESRAQMDFFQPSPLLGAKLADTLAKLVALAGEDRVGSPRLCDSHHPDAFTQVPWLHKDPPSAVARDACLPMRSVRPPLSVRVVATDNKPASVSPVASLAQRQGLRLLGGRVLRLAGPWRLDVQWWHEPLRRDYYDVALSDGGVYRLYFDHDADDWFIDGICG